MHASSHDADGVHLELTKWTRENGSEWDEARCLSIIHMDMQLGRYTDESAQTDSLGLDRGALKELRLYLYSVGREFAGADGHNICPW
jgi:hypothetical protein